MNKLWISGYYWGNNINILPPSKVDFSTMTHCMHFQVVPNSDGSLDSSALIGYNSSNSDTYCAEFIYHAQLAGCKALITIGGEGTESGFQKACSTDTSTQNFVNNIVAFVNKTRIYNGVTVVYDGVDIDWEPIGSYAPSYKNLIMKLRTALNSLGRSVTPTLTTAVTTFYADSNIVNTVSSVSSYLDQINVMTYPYGGSWSVWYISPLSGSPSINSVMPSFTAKIPASKLGFGMDFDALNFQGFLNPTPNSSSTQSDDQINSTYREIMATYFNNQPGPIGTLGIGNYHWDSSTNVPYLSIPGTPNRFISFENETSIQSKVTYAQNNGFGGIIVWELSGGYRPDLTSGFQDNLMQTLKALNNGAIIQPTPNPISVPIPAPVPVPVPTIPTVFITSPTSGSHVGSPVNVLVNVSSDVVSAHLYVDGSSVSITKTKPFNISWIPPRKTNTLHRLQVKVTNSSGVIGNSQIVKVYR